MTQLPAIKICQVGTDMSDSLAVKVCDVDVITNAGRLGRQMVDELAIKVRDENPCLTFIR
jgi:hypothetical protein